MKQPKPTSGKVDGKADSPPLQKFEKIKIIIKSLKKRRCITSGLEPRFLHPLYNNQKNKYKKFEINKINKINEINEIKKFIFRNLLRAQVLHCILCLNTRSPTSFIVFMLNYVKYRNNSN